MKLVLLVLATVLVSCAHHNNVIPGNDGTNSISIQAKTSNSGHSEALNEATHYCKKQNKTPHVVSEKRSMQTQMKTSNQGHSFTMTFTCK
jgi:hypothetical protein